MEVEAPAPSEFVIPFTDKAASSHSFTASISFSVSTSSFSNKSKSIASCSNIELSPSTAVSSIGANFAISTHFETSLSILSDSISDDETNAWR